MACNGDASGIVSDDWFGDMGMIIYL